MSEWTEKRRAQNRANLAISRQPVACPRCGKMVGRNNMKQHIGSHERRDAAEQAASEADRDKFARGKERKNPRDIQCPECMLLYTKLSIYGHMRTQHGKFWGEVRRQIEVSEVVNNTPKGTAIVLPTPIVPRPLLKPNIGIWRESPNFVILVDSDGDEWICERMNKK